MKQYLFPVSIWVLFEVIAVTLWLAMDNLFYLLNFTYIGSCLAIGIVFYMKKYKYARHIVQFAIGLYMLVYLGIILNENMQIEGFWYYLFLADMSNLAQIMLRFFLIGNLIYYGLGIILAFILHDNRAFCKYICPITVFLKPASYYALLRVKFDEDTCILCGNCIDICPTEALSI